MSARSTERELIDSALVEGEPLRIMLRELGVINRLLGGISCSLSVLGEVLSRERTWSVLDVGTGGADLPIALTRWSRRRGVRVRLIGCDLSVPTCREAKARCASAAEPAGGATDFVAADAFRLPFADQSIDVVHCALFLHHVADADIPAFLGELLRVARVGLLINDLHRHPIAEWSIRQLTRLFSRSRYIRHDAPLSVRRAFTRNELAKIPRALGRAQSEIRWHWAFRYSVWVPAGPPPASPAHFAPANHRRREPDHAVL